MSNLIQTLELSMLTTLATLLTALYTFLMRREAAVLDVAVREVPAGLSFGLSFALRPPTAVDCVGLLVSFIYPIRGYICFALK